MLTEFMQRNQAHFYFVQETKFGEQHRFMHSNFNAFAANNRPGCGGSMVLVHHRFKTRNVRSIIGDIDAILLDVFVENQWITIGSVYVHPTTTVFDGLVRLFPTNMPMLLGGDWNARHIDCGDVSTNRLGEMLLQLSIDENLSLHSSIEPTCFRMPEGSFLDKFLTNDRFRIATSIVSALPSFSDHCGIMITLHCNSFALNVRNGFTLRQFGLTNVVGMNRFIEERIRRLEIPSNLDLEDGDLEFIAQEISTIFGEAASTFVPEKFIKTNGIILSSGTLSLVRRTHSLQRKLWRNRTAGLRSRVCEQIKVELNLVRQMMLNAISHELNQHYRRTLSETRKMSDAYRTVITNTGHRKKMKCPALLYKSSDKTGLGLAQITD